MVKKLFFLHVLLIFTACGSSSKTESPGECLVTNCHGSEVICGVGEPTICTSEYVLGDLCRSYVTCEVENSECVPVQSAKYSQCVACLEKCKNLPAVEAFNCDSECREELD